jgi:hypothetical protein
MVGMSYPIAVHPITGAVYGPPTREQYVTAIAERIREETGIAWEYACHEAIRAFDIICALQASR